MGTADVAGRSAGLPVGEVRMGVAVTSGPKVTVL